MMESIESEQSLAFLPSWLDDETLYSWAGRFHVLQGRCSEKETGFTLFGRCHAARLHEIPTGAAHFVAFTRGKLGLLPEIIQRRTVLIEMRPFMSTAAWESMLEQFLTDDKVADMRTTIGLTAGGMGKVRPLRYCGECVKFELVEFGMPYWHLQHQLHGSFVCLQHHKPLELLEHHRTVWVLPNSRSAPRSAPIIPDKLLPSALLLSRLANICIQLSKIQVASFADAAIRCLQELGLVTSLPRISVESLSAWFIQTKTRNVAAAYYPNQTDLNSGDWIVRLLRVRRAGHPIHWLLLWSAILEIWPEDIAIRKFTWAAKGILFKSSQDELWPELSEDQRIKVPIHQAQIILQSATVNEAALRLGQTHGTIKRWLALDEDLKFQWRMQQRDDRQSLAIRRIEDVLKLYPQITRSELLKKCKTDMSWLSSNAKMLFSDFLDRIPAIKKMHETQSLPFLN